MSSSSQTRRGLLGAVSSTVGYATTQCISTLRKLLGAATLRRGDGVISLPESRRKERLLGVGRTKLPCLKVGQKRGAVQGLQPAQGHLYQSICEGPSSPEHPRTVAHQFVLV